MRDNSLVELISTLSLDEAMRHIPSPVHIYEDRWYFGFVKSGDEYTAGFRNRAGVLLFNKSFKFFSITDLVMSILMWSIDSKLFTEEDLQALLIACNNRETAFDVNLERGQNPLPKIPGLRWDNVGDISRLLPGNLVRNRRSQNVYFIQANYGSRATGSSTCDITNPNEWEMLVQDKEDSSNR